MLLKVLAVCYSFLQQGCGLADFDYRLFIIELFERAGLEWSGMARVHGILLSLFNLCDGSCGALGSAI